MNNWNIATVPLFCIRETFVKHSIVIPYDDNACALCCDVIPVPCKIKAML